MNDKIASKQSLNNKETIVNWTRSVLDGKLEVLSLKSDINEYFEPISLDTIDTYYNTLCRSLFGLKTVIGLQ